MVTASRLLRELGLTPAQGELLLRALANPRHNLKHALYDRATTLEVVKRLGLLTEVINLSEEEREACRRDIVRAAEDAKSLLPDEWQAALGALVRAQRIAGDINEKACRLTDMGLAKAQALADAGLTVSFLRYDFHNK